MSKKNLLPSRARHILVYDQDWVFLEAMYGRQGGAKPLGTSVAIRAIIHAYCQRLNAGAEQKLDESTIERVVEL